MKCHKRNWEGTFINSTFKRYSEHEQEWQYKSYSGRRPQLLPLDVAEIEVHHTKFRTNLQATS